MLNKQIECFLLVARLKSFSKAAKMLFLSPQAVSQQIKLLERDTGVILFYRTNKGVSLTPAGEFFYVETEEIVRRYDKAVHNVRARSGVTDKTVKIGVISSDSNRILPAVLGELRRQHNDIEVRFQKTTFFTMVDDLKLRTFDLCFVYGKTLIESEDIAYHTVAQDVIACVVPADHRLGSYDRIFLSDLCGESMLIVEEGVSEYHDRIRSYIIANKPEIHLQSMPDEIAVVRNVCKMSACVWVCARLSMSKDINLKIMPFEDDPPIEIGLLCRKEHNPLIKEFLRVAKTSLKELIDQWQYD